MSDHVYLLGTDSVELRRLQLQHDVWKPDVDRLIDLACVKTGDWVVDLGAGPGFLSMELAERVGDSGRVVGVDASNRFSAYFRDTVAKRQLSHLDFVLGDVLAVDIESAAYDLVVARWLFSFLKDPEAVIHRVIQMLKPGGRLVIFDYVNYHAAGFKPPHPILEKGFEAIFNSFAESGGNLNIGDTMPTLLTNAGLSIEGLMPVHRLARGSDPVWQWFDDFRLSYFPKLCDAGYLSHQEMAEHERVFKAYRKDKSCFFMTPPMIGIIALKVSV